MAHLSKTKGVATNNWSTNKNYPHPNENVIAREYYLENRMKKKVGLVVNPIAGIGGTVGLKGSDGAEIQAMAVKMGARKRAVEKAGMALEGILPIKDDVIIYAAPGEMGACLAQHMGFTTVALGKASEKTTGAHTEEAVRILGAVPVDFLLFAGGDGTARNVRAALPEGIPVIGVPAGVKIHSGVYATSIAAAGKALRACLNGTVPVRQAEVMDIDEDMYRAGRLQTKLYGYMPVPILRGFMQNPKAASFNDENDVGGICEEIKDRIRACLPNQCFIFGAGSTVAAVEKSLGLEGTLLGIDVAQNGKLIAKDVAEAELLKIAKDHVSRLIITAIGGQGHILGRGNQQLSPAVIRLIGLENIWVVATASKIYSLPEQTLYADTGDRELDDALRGYRRVVIGWQNTLLCQVR